MLKSYKSTCVLVHGDPSIHGFAEGLLDETRWGEIRKSLSQVNWLIVSSQLSEFHPTNNKNKQCLKKCLKLRVETLDFDHSLRSLGFYWKYVLDVIWWMGTNITSVGI